MSSREKIQILRNVRAMIQTGQMAITNQLLTLLEKSGVNLEGYKNYVRNVPIEENKDTNVSSNAQEKTFQGGPKTYVYQDNASKEA